MLELALLSDNNVDGLITLLWYPGGRIPNPGVLIEVQPEDINNPKTLVSMRAVTNLKLACFYTQHKDRLIDPQSLAT